MSKINAVTKDPPVSLNKWDRLKKWVDDKIQHMGGSVMTPPFARKKRVKNTGISNAADGPTLQQIANFQLIRMTMDAYEEDEKTHQNDVATKLGE